MVTVEYHIDPARAAGFNNAVMETRAARLRQGRALVGAVHATPPCRAASTSSISLDENWIEHQRRLERFTRHPTPACASAAGLPWLDEEPRAALCRRADGRRGISARPGWAPTSLPRERAAAYLAGYPPALVEQVSSLMAQDRPAEVLLRKYPHARGTHRPCAVRLRAGAPRTSTACAAQGRSAGDVRQQSCMTSAGRSAPPPASHGCRRPAQDQARDPRCGGVPRDA